MVIRKDWIYIYYKKLLYIDISNPKKTLNKIKGVFKPLELYFKFTKDIYAPYPPVFWVQRPAFIQIMTHDVGWKDKYDSPRYEESPYIWIHIYKWNFVWYWDLPLHQDHLTDSYWEQALWYLHYYDNTSYGSNEPDINKAKESWPWTDYKTKKSTWINGFIIK